MKYWKTVIVVLHFEKQVTVARQRDAPAWLHCFQYLSWCNRGDLLSSSWSGRPHVALHRDIQMGGIAGSRESYQPLHCKFLFNSVC